MTLSCPSSQHTRDTHEYLQPRFPLLLLPADPLCSSLCSRELSSSRRGSIQHTIEGDGSTTPSPPDFASNPKGRMQASLSARGVAAVAPQPPDHPAVSPSPSRRPSLPLLSLPNSASTTPSAAMLTATGCVSDPPSTLQGQVSAQGRAVGSAAGHCSTWQVLVELLMVNSSMGQATVLQHMAETRGIRLALPLQHAVSFTRQQLCGGCTKKLHTELPCWPQSAR